MSSITHYDGCWHDPKHHACAVREIEQLHTSYGLLCDDYKQLLIDNELLRDLEAAGIRLDLAQTGIHEAELRRISDACDAEIERLRDALVIANTTAANLHEEIERLRDQLQIRAGHVLDLERKATQRGARMQLLRESMSPHSWEVFCKFRPEAAEWFDEDGVPR